MSPEEGPHSESAHDRMYKIIFIIAAAIVGYTEIRIQLVSDSINDLQIRFNQHTIQAAHEGQKQSTEFLKELIYFIMNEIGLNINP